MDNNSPTAYKKETPNTEDIDNKLLEYFSNAEHISIIPLLKLVYLTTGLDLSEKFKLKYSVASSKSDDLIAGELIFSNPKDTEKKYKIFLDIVDKDYDLLDGLNNLEIFDAKIDSFNDIQEDIKTPLISAISFMTRACLVIFNKLKDENKYLLEYNLVLDDNTTIYIDKLLDMRIGIIFKQC
jgi:hypothetical protein